MTLSRTLRVSYYVTCITQYCRRYISINYYIMTFNFLMFLAEFVHSSLCTPPISFVWNTISILCEREAICIFAPYLQPQSLSAWAVHFCVTIGCFPFCLKMLYGRPISFDVIWNWFWRYISPERKALNINAVWRRRSAIR